MPEYTGICRNIPEYTGIYLNLPEWLLFYISPYQHLFRKFVSPFYLDTWLLISTSTGDRGYSLKEHEASFLEETKPDFYSSILFVLD